MEMSDGPTHPPRVSDLVDPSRDERDNLADLQPNQQANPQPDPLADFRPGVAPCVICGYARRGLPAEAPCPECGERCPPEEALVVPARSAGRSRKHLTFILLMAGFVLAINAPFAGVSRTAWPMIAFWVVWTITSLVGWMRRRPAIWIFSAGGVTASRNGVLRRGAWAHYVGVEDRRGELCLIAGRGAAVSLRSDLPRETLKAAASEINRIRSRSCDVPGSSFDSVTLASVQVCERCGACRKVRVGGACRVCGAAMPAGEVLIGGVSHPLRPFLMIRPKLGSPLGAAIVLGAGTLMALFLRAVGGEWFPAILIASVATGAGLALALFSRLMNSEQSTAARDCRDLYWLISGDSLRVITSLGDSVLPREKIDRVEPCGKRGRWTRVRATPNDPRFREQVIWFANEDDLKAAMEALHAPQRSG
jgi:hypothetical protein